MTLLSDRHGVVEDALQRYLAQDYRGKGRCAGCVADDQPSTDAARGAAGRDRQSQQPHIVEVIGLMEKREIATDAAERLAPIFAAMGWQYTVRNGESCDPFVPGTADLWKPIYRMLVGLKPNEQVSSGRLRVFMDEDGGIGVDLQIGSYEPALPPGDDAAYVRRNAELPPFAGAD